MKFQRTYIPSVVMPTLILLHLRRKGADGLLPTLYSAQVGSVESGLVSVPGMWLATSCTAPCTPPVVVLEWCSSAVQGGVKHDVVLDNLKLFLRDTEQCNCLHLQADGHLHFTSEVSTIQQQLNRHTQGGCLSTERERDLLQVPHFFVGTLQPL